MPRNRRRACLLVWLALAAGSLVVAQPPRPDAAAAASESVKGLPPAPRWAGGTDASGKAQLTWIGNPAFASVRVYRRDDGSRAAFRPLAETRESSWLDDTAQVGRTYYYRLAAIDSDGREGPPSAELAVRIGATAKRLPVPPDWMGYLQDADGVNFRWSAREGEDVIAWNIYRKSPPEKEFQLVGSTQTNNFKDIGLEPGRPYTYALTVLDSDFRETHFSRELSVTVARPRTPSGLDGPPPAWIVRRTRLVKIVGGGGGVTFERPADVAVGPASGRVYVTDSARNLVFVFSAQGAYQATVGAAGTGDESAFKNLLGLAIDRNENLYAVDAGTGEVRVISSQGGPGRRLALPRRAAAVTGLIDAAVGPDGRVYVVDNYNNKVAVVGGGAAAQAFGQAGARVGEFSAPTFCDVDAAGNLYVADCLNARVQVFSSSGEFVRAFGRAERAPGGFGRPKGVAVSAAGEIYVADSWFNTIQVFDNAGRFVAILGDETGKPLDLGSPNGVALGPGNRVYVAERLAARLQIREVIDVP